MAKGIGLLAHCLLLALFFCEQAVQAKRDVTGGCLAELMTVAGIPRRSAIKYEKAMAGRKLSVPQVSTYNTFALVHFGVSSYAHALKLHSCLQSGKCLKYRQCRGRGTCSLGKNVRGASSYTCRCLEGYKGHVCQNAVNPCKPSPCAYGGQCRRRRVDFVCTCKSGYSGKRCQDHWLTEKAFDKKVAILTQSSKQHLDAVIMQMKSSVDRLSSIVHGLAVQLKDVVARQNCLRASYPSAMKTSGVFRAKVNSHPFQAYCDMKTDGGGWIVFQRRQDGSVDFNRVWNEYKKGFGSPAGEFWLGLDTLHRLTSSGRYEFRVDMIDGGNRNYYAKYSSIIVTAESDTYRLKLGSVSGTIPVKTFERHSGYAFSTKDRDNDNFGSLQCGKQYGAGWSMARHCYVINMNGKYGSKSHSALGVWGLHGGKPYPLKFLELKIRSI